MLRLLKSDILAEVLTVIPAKAEIQALRDPLDPGLRRGDDMD
jgi:hypothetical protein